MIGQELAVPVTVLAGLLGVLIGSFLNVVVYRVPAGLSVVSPPSSCPDCSHQIRRVDNIPVVSWLMLGGRCRDCATPISARYPLVELGSGIAFVLVALRFTAGGQEPTTGPQGAATLGGLALLAAYLYLMGVSIPLALIDLETHKLPNKIVLPAYVVLPLLLTGASWGSGDWEALLRALIGLAILGGAYLLLAVAVPGGMGLGDVKLAGVLGFTLAYLGWGPLAVGSFSGFAFGGIFAFILVLLHRTGHRKGIPFGPWMLVGTWFGIVSGPVIWHGYLHLLGVG